MNKLEGKIALVTGATSGIGQKIAEVFAAEGANVIIIGRNKERGEQTAAKINSNRGNAAKFFACDITKYEEIEMLQKKVAETYGKLDILVNCAGIYKTFLLKDITAENFDETFHINTAAVMFMTKFFVEMLEKTHGNIINVASIGGLQTNVAGRSQYLYAASKAATVYFSQLCALNYAPNVRVNCLCPGPTDTPIFVNKDFSNFERTIPMKRVGKPEEPAKAALFLASDDAAYITGAILTVDGGASI